MNTSCITGGIFILLHQRTAHFYAFWPIFDGFVQILPRIKTFSKISKCVHHPRTIRHICATLRPSQSYTGCWEKADTSWSMNLRTGENVPLDTSLTHYTTSPSESGRRAISLRTGEMASPLTCTGGEGGGWSPTTAATDGLDYCPSLEICLFTFCQKLRKTKWVSEQRFNVTVYTW